MIVGVPREIKSDEYRVAMLPVGAEELTQAGPYGPDRGGGRAGQRDRRRPVRGGRRDDRGRRPPRSGPRPTWWSRSRSRSRRSGRCLRPGQTLFTYFHFAADERLTTAIIDSGITAIAYETLRDARGGLPLLTPMSEVAGRMSIQEGAKYLERPQEGRGHPALRRAGRRPGRGRHPGRRRRRLQRRQGRRRPGGQRPDPRHQPRPAPLPRRHHAAQRHDALFRPAHDPRVDRARRPRHRRRPDHRAPAPRGWCAARTSAG